MSWWEILIIVAAAVFVTLVIAFSIRRKLRGKTCCGECSGCCSSCAGCPSRTSLPLEGKVSPKGTGEAKKNNTQQSP